MLLPKTNRSVRFDFDFDFCGCWSFQFEATPECEPRNRRLEPASVVLGIADLGRNRRSAPVPTGALPPAGWRHGTTWTAPGRRHGFAPGFAALRRGFT